MTNDVLSRLIPPNPHDMSLTSRRVFVLTLPLSASLWVLWWIGLFLVFIIVAIVALILGAFLFVAYLFVAPLIWVRDQIIDLWRD